MYWLLPRSHCAARAPHERAGVRFSSTDDGPLPQGAAARLLLVWMHLEAQRTKSPTLALGHSLEAFARSLDLDAAALAGQAGRLCACTVSHEGATGPMATPVPGPALRLGTALHEAFRRHPLEVSAPCLRDLSTAVHLLDYYLRKCYTREYYRVDLTMPGVRELLRLGPEAGSLYRALSAVWRAASPGPGSGWARLYQECAERPSPAPTERELLDFRNNASGDQLAVFVVETRFLFEERRARLQALLYAG